MSFLQLKDIGKIYVSENNVAVGVRGVNLSFELGEFVAITGASGSGKSTLLNVLSGMDSYEEGELFIEGKSTSHYLQADWEQYRQKYISFIFQDYNIIDSFTVLQNVELALMSITDPLERRKRAIDLIDRVGLRKHMKHKGSHLSGGQKQRTVIARALAKDSPIILADEPTGNLDSETSKEIIELLREVSRDKLLIMVTHNYDQVENVATRHIRVYDGAIESDRVLRTAQEVTAPSLEGEVTPGKQRRRTLSNGILLGRSVFVAKPHLSLYLCLLMIVGAVAMFFVTAFCGDFLNVFRKHHFFRYEEGRVVIVHYDDTPVTEEELEDLGKTMGAKRTIRYDYLFDCRLKGLKADPEAAEEKPGTATDYSTDKGVFSCTFDRDFGEPDIGHYPQSESEVLLYMPIYYKTVYDEEYIRKNRLYVGATIFEIVGVVFTADNSEPATALMTEEGFRRATCGYALDMGIEYIITDYDDPQKVFPYSYDRFFGQSTMHFYVGDHMPEHSVFVDSRAAMSLIRKLNNYAVQMRSFMALQTANRYLNQQHDHKGERAKELLLENNLLSQYDGLTEPSYDARYVNIYVSPDLAWDMLLACGNKNYNQGSLFFENRKEAAEAAKKLNDMKYVALTADDTYDPDVENLVSEFLTAALKALVWIVAIAFLAFFINLCSHRAIAAFRADMAIMRSMGIPAKVIRIGIYVRMFLSLLPAFVVIPVLAYVVYHIPKMNAKLMYLQPWHYVLLYVGLFILMLRVTGAQVGKLFSQSVKRTLRGGEEA